MLAHKIIKAAGGTFFGENWFLDCGAYNASSIDWAVRMYVHQLHSILARARVCVNASDVGEQPMHVLRKMYASFQICSAKAL